MKGTFIILGILVFIVLVILLIFNSLIRAKNRVKEAFATMDVYLKKRWELVPNLVEAVRGYAKHEESTLEEVIRFRNNNYDNFSDKDKINAGEEITKGINRLMAIAEAYPELKANENFLHLSAELTKLEDEIANSRKYYNATVRSYNNKVEMFPSNIVARLLKYETENMYEAKDEEKENRNVNFN